MSIEENPYLTPTTETTESVVDVPLSSLFMRGAQSGGIVGFGIGSFFAVMLFIMHGAIVSTGAVLVLLISVGVCGTVGMGLAGISQLEKRFRGSRPSRVEAKAAVGGAKQDDMNRVG